jgi:hypothetical protein
MIIIHSSKYNESSFKNFSVTRPLALLIDYLNSHRFTSSIDVTMNILMIISTVVLRILHSNTYTVQFLVSSILNRIAMFRRYDNA